MDIKFFRSVASLLTVCGVVGLSAATLSGVLVYCGGGTPACLSAAVTFGLLDTTTTITSDIQTTTAISTPMRGATSPLATFVHVVQFLSIYAILIGVLVLIALEFRELHYLKQLYMQGRPSR